MRSLGPPREGEVIDLLKLRRRRREKKARELQKWQKAGIVIGVLIGLGILVVVLK